MIREAYEDYQRYKSDSETNKAPVFVFRENQFKNIRSDEVKVGDILLIEDGQIFPADLLLLNSSFEDGTCFIQTSSLDGEKNLKKRKMPKDLDKLIQPGNKEPDQLIFVGESFCEAPSADLYSFVGKL